MNKRNGLIAAGITCVLVAVGGAAYAASSSIPDSNGLIHGCYQSNGAGATNGTPLNIIDTSQASCGKNQTPITWNQTGPAGPRGAVGPAGPGYTFTATLGGAPGSPGPQLTHDGTYFVNAVVEFYNHDPVNPLIGNCPILAQRSNGQADGGFWATFML